MVVMASGNGTNLQYIIDCIDNNILKNYEIVAIVCNKKNAYSLKRAEIQSISSVYFPYIKDKMERSMYEHLLAGKVIQFSPDIVVLAGWMHILSKSFLQYFKMIINLHPALPDKMPGKDAIERAFYESRDFYKNENINSKSVYKTGAMCHKVIEKVDAGKVFAVQEVTIDRTDTLNDVKHKIAIAEKNVLLGGIIESSKYLV